MSYLIQITLPEQDRKKNKFKNSCKDNNCPIIIHNCIVRNIQNIAKSWTNSCCCGKDGSFSSEKKGLSFNEAKGVSKIPKEFFQA